MTRPAIVLDPHWRRIAELFSEADRAELQARYEVIWGQDAPAPEEVIREGLARAVAFVAAEPVVTAEVLATAPNLRAVIEVSGSFPGTIDYAACAARGVDVLSCAPGFRQSVAEMTLAMMLAGGRGLMEEHERFRRGQERWLADNAGTDFTLFGQDVGFVGYGSISREVHRLIVPFGPVVRAYDPWLDPARAEGCKLVSLAEVMRQSRCVIVAAAPTAENAGLISVDLIAEMQPGALLIVISRAHLVDFDAVVAAAEAGRIRAAIDVFPEEPVPADAPVRTAPNVLLSPHRAAAVEGGRQLIGRMILDDLDAILAGRPERRLSRADPAQVDLLAGVGDAKSVAAMGLQR